MIDELRAFPTGFARLSIARRRSARSPKNTAAFDNFLYLGRQFLYPVALEGALKLKEISYIHAEGYPAAEMKHGPIALVDEQTPSVFLVPQGPVFEKVMTNLEEVAHGVGRSLRSPPTTMMN